MKLSELLIIAAFAVVIAYALVTAPFDSIASFNPVELFANSVKGFFDWFINLFFGWIP